MVPVTRQVVLDGDTPVFRFAKLHRGPYGFLLEFARGWGASGPATLLSTVRARCSAIRGRTCARWRPIEAGGRWSPTAAARASRRLLRRTPRGRAGVAPVHGGRASGTWATTSFDHRVAARLAPGRRELPDAVMMVTDTLLVLDNLYNRATVIANVEVDPEADDAELRRLYGRRRGADRRLGGRLAAPGGSAAGT